MKTIEMEISLAEHFNYLNNIIIPSMSWGILFNHELDLLIITKSGYGYEVEIKISKQDLIKDLEKCHKHESNKIKRLYFAIPEYLVKHIQYIPEIAGIIVVKEKGDYESYNKCEVIREPKNKSKYKFKDDEIIEILHQGMRKVWTLKKKLTKK